MAPGSFGGGGGGAASCAAAETAVTATRAAATAPQHLVIADPRLRRPADIVESCGSVSAPNAIAKREEPPMSRLHELSDDALSTDQRRIRDEIDAGPPGGARGTFQALPRHPAQGTHPGPPR